MALEIQNFYGVYILISENPRYKGRTYIGFTVNPSQRLRQHNAGFAGRGARKTSGKGPWTMVLVVHGFPNMISALRFEWAWQHPQKSSALKDVDDIKKMGRGLSGALGVLSVMLCTPPWYRLPLTLRWLSPPHVREFQAPWLPPCHMPVTFGPVTVKPVKKKPLGSEELKDTSMTCIVCAKSLKSCDEDCLVCPYSSSCAAPAHMTCLARHSTDLDLGLLPVTVTCPQCSQEYMWGDLIRAKLGVSFTDQEEVSELQWTQQLSKT